MSVQPVTNEKKREATHEHKQESANERAEDLATFFAYPTEIRRLIYTTNTIEGYNRGLRKVIKTKSTFPTPEATRKRSTELTPKSALSGEPKHHQAMDHANSELGQRLEPVSYPIWQPIF